MSGRRTRLCVEDAIEYARALSYREDAHILRELLAALGTGDVCWDVGASMGLYTTLLASVVGPTGQVAAFEPEEWSRRRLSRNVELNGQFWVTIVAAALGDRTGQARLRVDGHYLSGAHQLVGSGETEGEGPPVRILTADEAMGTFGLRPPNVIKIDVEGFECEVLHGARAVIAARSCRTVVCEVHFTLLEARGLRSGPDEVRSILMDAGFHQQRWLDHSHLLASKDL